MNRRQFLAAAPLAPVAVALAVAPPRSESHPAIREAVRAYEAAKASHADVYREYQALDARHPGPNQPGGTRENFEIVARFEDDQLDPSSADAGAALRRLDTAIRSAGFRGVIVGGKVYISVSDDARLDESSFGIDRNLLIDLDTGKAVRS